MNSLKNLQLGLEMLRNLDSREKTWVATRLSKSTADVHTAAELLSKLPSGSNKAKGPSVFLSHSSKDKPFVRALARKLEPYRIRVWLDAAELNIGDSLIEKISSVIDEVDLVLAVISENSVASSWVREELRLAMSDQIAGRRVKILPIRKDNAPVPRFLRGRLYGDFTNPYRRQKGLEPLVQSIYAQANGVA
jgi:TIR domain